MAWMDEEGQKIDPSVVEGEKKPETKEEADRLAAANAEFQQDLADRND